jgi:hypothetical protein
MSMSPSSLISEFDHSMPVRARRFVVSAGALRIADQGADQPKQPILFGMSWSAKKRADFDIGHLTASRGIRLVPDQRPRRSRGRGQETRYHRSGFGKPVLVLCAS